MLLTLGMALSAAASQPLPRFSFDGVTVGESAPFGHHPLTDCLRRPLFTVCDLDANAARALRVRFAKVFINPDEIVCGMSIIFTENDRQSAARRLTALYGQPRDTDGS